jgi:hypothetical protein
LLAAIFLNIPTKNDCKVHLLVVEYKQSSQALRLLEAHSGHKSLPDELDHDEWTFLKLTVAMILPVTRLSKCSNENNWFR